MQDKNKKKSDKLLKQSFALLDKIKQRKEKQVLSAPNQQNYVQDLYLKIFDKCSPHFNKTQTANSILTHIKEKEKECSKRKMDFDDLQKQFLELRNQNLRLKESKDEVSRIKSLNAEIQILEQKARVLSTQLKEERREKDKYMEITENMRKENASLKQNNNQLEQLVQKLSKQLENYLTHESGPGNTQSQLDQIKLRNTELEKEMSSLLKERELLKEKVEMNSKIYEEKFTKVRSSESSLKYEVEKQVQQLRGELQKEKIKAKQLQQDQFTRKNLQEDIKLANDQIEKLTRQNKRLKDEVEQLSTKNQQYQIHKSSQQIKLNNKIRQLASAQQHNKRLNAQIAQRGEKQKQLEATIKECAAKLGHFQNIQSQFKKEQEKVRNLEQQLTSLKERCFEVETLNDALRKELNNTINNVQSSKQSLQEQRKKQKQWSQYQKEKQTLLNSKSEEIKQLKNQLENMKSQISKTNQSQLDSNSKLNKVTLELQGTLKEKQQQKRAWQNQKTQLESQIEEISERIKFFKSSYEEINNQKADLIQSIQALVQQNNRLTNQITKLQAAQKDSKQSQLQDQKKVQNLLQTKSEQINLLTDEINRLKYQVSKTSDGKSQASEKLKKLGQEVEKSVKQKDELMLAWDRQKGQLQTTIQQVTERMKFFKESNQQLNNERVDLINSVQALVAQNKTLADQLQTLTTKYDEQLALERNRYTQLKQQQDILQSTHKTSQSEKDRLKEEAQLLKQQIQLLNLKLDNQNLEEQMLLELPDKVQSLSCDRTSKHIETIKELNSELTQAYKTIGLLSSRLQEYESSQKKEKEANNKKSPESKDRGKSIKKIAGMFGFK